MNSFRPSGYHSYLLRLWRQDQLGPWRASLQNTDDHQIQHFADVTDAWTYLQKQMAADSQTNHEIDGHGEEGGSRCGDN